MFNRICYQFTRLLGWSYKINIPDDVKSFVMVGAPHTSNWDILPTVAVIHLLKRNTRFIMKNSWLKFPLNIPLESMGAIGIDRELIKKDGQGNTTDAMSDLFKQYPYLILMISPEGTRKPNEQWKTGFYYIAKKAGVPIVLFYADYAKKEVGTGPIIYPKDYEEDMKIINNFFKDITGKNPENFKLDKRFT